MIRHLDPAQLSVLRQVGRGWARVSATPEAAREALPVDPNLGRFPTREELAPAGTGRVVEMPGLSGQIPAPDEAEGPWSTRWGLGLRRMLLGAPLKNTAITHESMRKAIALPVLSADALSSVAYGPEAMLTILVLAGAAGVTYSLPIAAVIVFMMLALGISYRQTIRAYPHGGGSYIVSSANLGRGPGLFSAAGLMIDYVLTVAVSISAGMAAMVAVFPGLHSAIVPIGVLVILLLLAGNLRGIRQAGLLFAMPTYAFMLAVFGVVVVGLIHPFGQAPSSAGQHSVTESVGLLLILRAFASGSTAMTGIEAISNAVPVFRSPAWRNARTTLTWMIGILICLFLGIMVLAHIVDVIPVAGETVLSQLARRSFGDGVLFWFTQIATAGVLMLAANTAYNDFPRVLFLMARDDQAPRIFLRFGDRLAFSNGIIVLSVAAAAVYIGFGGVTAALIPLYAVGVFLAFTLSQWGMVMHWWRRRESHWRKSLAFNAAGAVLSAVVLLIAAVTKFMAGAWVALVGIGLLVVTARLIRRHYQAVDKAVRLHPDAIELPVQPLPTPVGDPRVVSPPAGESEETPQDIQNFTVVGIPSIDLSSLRALAYAASLGQPVMALHISAGDEEAEQFRAYWGQWGNHVPLEVVVSPYRAIVAPMVRYLEALHRQNPNLTLTVVLPEIVARRRYRLLHSRTANRLRRALRPHPKIVITTIPFHVT
ncbi:amino acid/polyamine/organocation transporter (APC superfamily) [Stackebrandtia endophytica]|uniref:Amino acid/polyamine/organocation transporter (APC superfamily) n=1 Tax=Stackebrandtia endophytica TaxID=1496996 RepID=A0A543ARV3_9ACTN|nr:amino acid/polyamine/organocation transporter (APC superfamily) [Stackebrandtia endophytica]